MIEDDDDPPQLISAKVPVTILTGFLGSGKTTLLHYVLTAEHQLRIAVIVNEFEFGKTIEKGLTLKSSEKADDEWVELNNGCMCCTAHSQTIQALEGLMRRKGTFDLILIETSGLADPGPVASMFWQDDAVCGNLYLSGIVTLVDSVNILRYLSDSEVQAEATRQVLLADKIVLNKCDLATGKDLERAREAISQLNPAAEVVETQFSRVPQLHDLLFLNTTKSIPSLCFQHVHGKHEGVTVQSGSGNNSAKAGITAVPLEFMLPDRILAASSVKDLEEICKQLLYPSEGASSDEVENNEETTEKTVHFSAHAEWEVMRSKAAVWVRHETQSDLTNESTPSYVLYQIQSIGEIFDIVRMEGQSVPLGCSRVLVLGKRLPVETLQKIFMQYLKPYPKLSEQQSCEGC